MHSTPVASGVVSSHVSAPIKPLILLIAHLLESKNTQINTDCFGKLRKILPSAIKTLSTSDFFKSGKLVPVIVSFLMSTKKSTTRTTSGLFTNTASQMKSQKFVSTKSRQ